MGEVTAVCLFVEPVGIVFAVDCPFFAALVTGTTFIDHGDAVLVDLAGIDLAF